MLLDSMFNKYESIFKEDKSDKSKKSDKYLYLTFKNYFQKQWQSHFLNGPLIYNKINKKNRCICFIENYNKCIKFKISKNIFG